MSFVHVQFINNHSNEFIVGILYIYFIEVLNLEDTLHATNETLMNNPINNQPGTSSIYENTHLWTPLESTKLLRTTEKHKKLASNR